MQRKNFAVPVKLWASGCTIVGISMTSNTVLTCILALTGFLYLSVQHNWRALKSFGGLCSVLRDTGAAAVPDPVSWPAHGGVLRVLCADVLEPVCRFYCWLGFDHDTPWRTVGFYVSYPYADCRYFGITSYVSFFPHYESRAEKCMAFYA